MNTDKNSWPTLSSAFKDFTSLVALNLFTATKLNYIQQIELAFCTVSLREDGIIEQRFLRDTPYEIDAFHLNEISQAMSRLSNGRKTAILSIAGLHGSITPEGRKADVTKGDEYTLAIALVIQELSQRLLANFYFKIKKVNYPVKIFKNEDEASGWLHQQIRANQQAG